MGLAGVFLSSAVGRWFDGGGNGKIYGKGMNVVRQISWRFGWMTRARTHSAVSDCVGRTVLFVPDPLKTDPNGNYPFTRLGITHPTPMGTTHLVNRQGRHVLSRHYAWRTAKG